MHSRQILTPDNTKRLLRLLEQHVRGFEQEFGEIVLPENAAQDTGAN